MSENRPSRDVRPIAGEPVLLLAASWNQQVVGRLLDGCQQRLRELQAEVVVERVPGTYELPTAASWAAASGRCAAVVAIGCVVRGETPHFELVANECARGLMEVSLRTHVPVIFGVLAVENEEQALARAGGSHGHAGVDAAEAAARMIRLRPRLALQSPPDA
jgi:6,7-dimethyl-8-ribityllumazine synthase